MQLLLVEDEKGIGSFVCRGLQEAGHRVDWAQTALEGLNYLLQGEYDVVILDIILPGQNGLSLLATLREEYRLSVPVLMLTALDGVDDRVRGLQTGADDYLIKPFDFSELLARLEALARRPPLKHDPLLRSGNVEMDLLRHVVKKDGIEVSLSQREFMLLEYLLRHAGQTLTRTQIGERIWGLDYAHDSKVIDVYIGYLRRKLDTPGAHSLIQTIRGVGFRLHDA